MRDTRAELLMGASGGQSLLVRSVPIKTTFRPCEAADLREIADAWQVPLATAVWAIVASQLSRWRSRAPELGQAGLAIAAASVVLGTPHRRARMAVAHVGAEGSPSRS